MHRDGRSILGILRVFRYILRVLAEAVIRMLQTDEIMLVLAVPVLPNPEILETHKGVSTTEEVARAMN